MIKLNGQIVEQNHFPDNSLFIKAIPMLASYNAHILIDWYYENDAELFTIICLRKHYSQYRATLFLEYCPHARMDRVKNSLDVFTLKYFAEVINSLNFEEVRILDPHSNVCTALINNSKVINPVYHIDMARCDCEPDMLFFPDEGSMKRYSANLKMLYAFGSPYYSSNVFEN